MQTIIQLGISLCFNMYEDVDLITEDLIKESESNSMSLIILNCQFCKKNCEHQIMVSWEIIKI